MKGKMVAITGASSGIGEHVAYEVAKRGGTPILLARSKDKLAQIAGEIESTYSVPCYYDRLDVSDISAIEEAFMKIEDTHGTIDVLVNNAGFGVFQNVEDIDLDEMVQMFAVNVFGLIACTKFVYSLMIKRGEGHIINIASQAGKIATPKSSVYAATKHAVLGFTNSLRMEAAQYGVYVTAVNPGPVKTSFFQRADTSGAYEENVKKIMLDAEYVARRAVDIMLTPTREVNVPGWMNIGSKLYQLFPGIIERVGNKAFFKK